MKIELNSATSKTDNSVGRIWKLRPVACTSCLTEVLLESPQMAKYFVKMLTLVVGMFRDQVPV